MIYEMAKKYYPNKWNKAMLERLLTSGKLTHEQFDEIVGN